MHKLFSAVCISAIVGFVGLLLSQPRITVADNGSSTLWSEFAASPASATLPDFSYAGYKEGEPIPASPATESVGHFGAKGDGTQDDTDAFCRAIRQAAGRTIEIPAGRYLLSDRLEITRAGTVLRGVGQGKTLLMFQRGLEAIDPYPEPNGGGTPTTGWSWDGGLIRFDGRNRNDGYSLPVQADVPARSTTLPMELVRNVTPGDLIELRVDDPGDNSLTNYIYAGAAGDARDSGTNICLRQLVKVIAIHEHAIDIDRPTRFEIRRAWSGRIILLEGRTNNCGIESMTIEMPGDKYLGHFQEKGFNAIQFIGTRDCWARDLELVNCDCGIIVSGDRTSVSDVVMRSTRPPAGAFDGHHGIYVRGTDNLIRDVNIQEQFIHDLTVERGASGNAFVSIRGNDLCLDHHRWGPFANLWCDIDLGKGTRAWASGGAGSRGKNCGTREVFWNIHGQAAIKPPPKDFAATGCIFVGVAGMTKPENGWIVAPDAQPSNLFDAQRVLRFKNQETRAGK